MRRRRLSVFWMVCNSVVSAAPTCDNMDLHPAVKELVQDANFECNEGGIVRTYLIYRKHMI